MLPKSKRLSSKDFLLYRPKVMFRGTYVDIAVAKIQDKESRFACVVSKKRIKRAVDRNKARRKVYHLLHDVQLKTAYMVVVYPKVSMLTGNSNLIKEEIRQSFATL